MSRREHRTNVIWSIRSLQPLQIALRFAIKFSRLPLQPKIPRRRSSVMHYFSWRAQNMSGISYVARYWLRARALIRAVLESYQCYAMSFENISHKCFVSNSALRADEPMPYKNTALRLYPVLPQLDRVTLAPTILPTGGGQDGKEPVFVAQGTRLMCHLCSLHRDSKVFGEDVEAFDPSRWSRISPSQWQYMPFGGEYGNALQAASLKGSDKIV